MAQHDQGSGPDRGALRGRSTRSGERRASEAEAVALSSFGHRSIPSDDQWWFRLWTTLHTSPVRSPISVLSVGHGSDVLVGVVVGVLFVALGRDSTTLGIALLLRTDPPPDALTLEVLQRFPSAHVRELLLPLGTDALVPLVQLMGEPCADSLLVQAAATDREPLDHSAALAALEVQQCRVPSAHGDLGHSVGEAAGAECSPAVATLGDADSCEAAADGVSKPLRDARDPGSRSVVGGDLAPPEVISEDLVEIELEELSLGGPGLSAPRDPELLDAADPVRALGIELGYEDQLLQRSADGKSEAPLHGPGERGSDTLPATGSKERVEEFLKVVELGLAEDGPASVDLLNLSGESKNRLSDEVQAEAVEEALAALCRHIVPVGVGSSADCPEKLTVFLCRHP